MDHSSVVFPQPDGPTMETIRFAPTSKVQSFSATKSP
jgi:hypothetical protein